MPVTSIPIPRISFGKRKERSQIMEILTDDGRWIDKEYPALSSCVMDESENTKLAFLLDPDNQYLADDGNEHQLVTEKSQIPLALRVPSKYQDKDQGDDVMKKLRDAIFKMIFRQKQAEGIDEIKNQDKWDKIFKVVVIICSTVLVIVGIRWISGGFG